MRQTKYLFDSPVKRDWLFWVFCFFLLANAVNALQRVSNSGGIELSPASVASGSIDAAVQVLVTWVMILPIYLIRKSIRKRKNKDFVEIKPKQDTPEMHDSELAVSENQKKKNIVELSINSSLGSSELIDVKECKRCKSIVSQNALECSNCEFVYFEYKKIPAPESIVGQNNGESTVGQYLLKRCPMCAEEIRIEALKCKHCGSRLHQSGMKKVLAKFESFLASMFSKKNTYKLGGFLMALFIILAYTFFQVEKSREFSALERNGVICVYGSDESTNYVDESTNFGCADYPLMQFSFCDKAPVHWPYLPDFDLRNLTPYKIQGKLSTEDGCLYSNNFYKEYQYLIEVNTQFRERLGDYKLSTLAYSNLDIDSYIEGGGVSDLFIRVALKN
jgi:hypothetical protein